jgi:hypothetical protein
LPSGAIQAVVETSSVPSRPPYTPWVPPTEVVTEEVTYTETITPSWTSHPVIFTETLTYTETFTDLTPEVITKTLTLTDGQKITSEFTVTPTIETDTYHARITPTWTSRPETETITQYKVVTPTVITETIKEISTETETTVVDGKNETCKTRMTTTHPTFVVETPIIEVETYSTTKEESGIPETE